MGLYPATDVYIVEHGSLDPTKADTEDQELSDAADSPNTLLVGDTTHVVAVRAAPGYGPAAGHVGTGQVVATVC